MRGDNERPGQRDKGTEFNGKTVDEAIRAAARRFRVGPDQLDIEVLDEGRGGFLGIGAKEARVRARLKRPAGSANSDSRRDSRRGGRGGPSSPQGGQGGGQGGQGGSQGGSPAGRPQPERRNEPPRARDEESRDGRGGNARRRGRRGGAGRGPQDQGPRDHAPREHTPRDHAPRSHGSGPPRERSGSFHRDSTPAVPTVFDAEVEKRIVDFVDGLLTRMGYPAEVSSAFEDGAYQLTVRTGADEEGVLIGRKGETLDALQHLAYKVSGRGRAEPSTIKIDVSGYREKREKELADVAVELAREVKSTGTARQTEPLRAADRRIVHRAVTDVGGVTTRALGTGLVKRIQIELEGATPTEAEAPMMREAPPRARGNVLDFVGQPSPEPAAAPATTSEANVSDWGRKPRPARPGRRR